MSHPLRSSFEKDLEDCLLFIKEVLLVTWRFNPASVAAYKCNQLFQATTDLTPNDQLARMLVETLCSIEIVPVESYEKVFATAITEFCKSTAFTVMKGAIKEYPQVENFLRGRCSQDETEFAASFSRLTFSAVVKQRQHYQQLEAYFAQLVEFAPRYVSIMNRTGVLDGILGFAAGFLGGYLGAAGAGVWENWRNSNDQDFCRKYASAFDQFVQSCIAYTTEGENVLSLVFDRLIDEIRQIHRQVFECYEELAQSGLDIEPLYIRYRSIDEPLDDNSMQLFEIAISNLEENRSVHYRSIENIRVMVGLTK